MHKVINPATEEVVAEVVLAGAGETDAAIAHYDAAAKATLSIPERNYLTTKAARLAGGSGSGTAQARRAASSGFQEDSSPR